MAKSKIARYRKARKNPSIVTQKTAEFATNVGAGFAGYAATRFLSRMVYSQAVKKMPKSAKHATVLASVAGAVGTYLGTRYYKKVSDHHEAASVGAGIALVQAVAQAYLPKYAWIVGDMNAEQYTKPKPAEQAADISMLEGTEPPDALASEVFDLDALLAEDDTLEAVPVGQLPPVPSATDDSDLDQYSGLLN